jgi:prepilin-type N-terminal cleavage/methylation domain-containing protein
MRLPQREKTAQSGFTFIEILVVLAVVGMMAVWLTPMLMGMMARIQLTSASRQVAISMQQARAEAVKRGFSALVQYFDASTCELANGKGCFRTYVDMDGDRVYTEGTDFPLGGPYQLPRRIDLWGPTDTAAEDTNAIVGFTTTEGPVFKTDGSVETAGAFRLRDSNGNFLEVRIVFPSTGKVSTKKWFGGGNPNTNWYENGESGKTWQW